METMTEQVQHEVARVRSYRDEALAMLEGAWVFKDSRAINNVRGFGERIDAWAKVGEDAAAAGKSPKAGWPAWSANAQSLLDGIREQAAMPTRELAANIKTTLAQAPQTTIDAAADTANKAARATAKAVKAAGAAAADAYHDAAGAVLAPLKPVLLVVGLVALAVIAYKFAPRGG